MYVHRCAWCGREFKSYLPNSKYCDKDCFEDSRTAEKLELKKGQYTVEERRASCHRTECLHYEDFRDNKCDLLRVVYISKCKFFKAK